MKRFKFTDAALRKLPMPSTAMEYWYDKEVPGLALRITDKGSRAFCLRYRTPAGRERYWTIGRFSMTSIPEWTTAAARDKAAELKEGIRLGRDPQDEAKATREEATVKQLCDRFIAEHLPKRRPATAYDFGRVIERDVLPALGAKKLSEVTDSDIEKLHRKITERGAPVRANTVLMYLSSIFNRAIKWKMATTNPCRGIEKNVELKRERYLTDEQIAKVLKALQAHEDKQASAMLTLALFTGARIGEIRSMRWDAVDFATGIWSKPASSTKQKKPHRTHLNAPARQILMQLREQAKAELDRITAELKKEPSAQLEELLRRVEAFVFATPKGALGYRLEVRDQWVDICKAAGLMGLRETRSRKTGKVKSKMMHSARIHDLRHSHASLLASAGYSLVTIGKMLGHSRTETTARYADLMDKPLREAAEKVGALITGATAEVIDLEQARKAAG